MARITVSRPAITREVTALDASPDGRVVVSARGEGSGARIEIWDGATGQKTGTFQIPHEIVRELRCLPDARRAVTHGNPGRTHLWDLDSGREIELPASPPAEPPTELSFEEKDRQTPGRPVADSSAASRPEPIPPGVDSLVVGGGVKIVREHDGAVSFWHAEAGMCLGRWAGVPSGRLVAAVPRPPRMLLRSDSDLLVLWDLESKSQRFSIPYTSTQSTGVPLSLGCSRLNWIALADTRLTMLSLESGETLWSVRPGRDMGSAVTALAKLADGRHLCTATLDAGLRLWRAADGARLATFPTDSRVRKLLIRGSRLVAGSALGTIYFLDLKGIESGRPFVELWPDGRGELLGRCPQCGWTGTWAGFVQWDVAICPSCGSGSTC